MIESLSRVLQITQDPAAREELERMLHFRKQLVLINDLERVLSITTSLTARAVFQKMLDQKRDHLQERVPTHWKNWLSIEARMLAGQYP